MSAGHVIKTNISDYYSKNCNGNSFLFQHNNNVFAHFLLVFLLKNGANHNLQSGIFHDARESAFHFLQCNENAHDDEKKHQQA